VLAVYRVRCTLSISFPNREFSRFPPSPPPPPPPLSRCNLLPLVELSTYLDVTASESDKFRRLASSTKREPRSSRFSPGQAGVRYSNSATLAQSRGGSGYLGGFAPKLEGRWAKKRKLIMTKWTEGGSTICGIRRFT